MPPGMSQHFPLLQVYDDTLHNRWNATCSGGASIRLDAPDDHSHLRSGASVPCGQSMRVVFNGSTQALTMRTTDAILMPDVSSLLLSFDFSFAGSGLCAASEERASRGTCAAAACVAVRSHGVRDADTSFVPLCASEMTAASSPPRASSSDRRRRRLRRHDASSSAAAAAAEASSPVWRQARLPLARLLGGAASTFDELLFVPSGAANAAPRLELRLDEIWIATARPPVAGERPPSYGHSDINPVRSNWLQGVRQGGAASRASKASNGHLCEYMTSEVGVHAGKRPLCQMDGDHLDGRWMQTCDPRTIQRPDHFAYGRALPAVTGWYDYRLCYRQSATERLRTLQAISWSWRPKSCALASVDGAAFDAWLGTRTLLFLGDSLQGATARTTVGSLPLHPPTAPPPCRRPYSHRPSPPCASRGRPEGC